MGMTHFKVLSVPPDNIQACKHHINQKEYNTSEMLMLPTLKINSCLFSFDRGHPLCSSKYTYITV